MSCLTWRSYTDCHISGAGGGVSGRVLHVFERHALFEKVGDDGNPSLTRLLCVGGPVTFHSCARSNEDGYPAPLSGPPRVPDGSRRSLWQD
jgi:hypothetical protein